MQLWVNEFEMSQSFLASAAEENNEVCMVFFGSGSQCLISEIFPACLWEAYFTVRKFWAEVYRVWFTNMFSFIFKAVTVLSCLLMQSRLRWAVQRWPRHREAELRAKRERNRWPMGTQERAATPTPSLSTCGWRMRRNITDRCVFILCFVGHEALWGHCLMMILVEERMYVWLVFWEVSALL